MVVGAGEGHRAGKARNPPSEEPTLCGAHLHGGRAPFAHLVYQWSMPVSALGNWTVHSIPLFSPSVDKTR